LNGSRAFAQILFLLFFVFQACSPKVRENKKETTVNQAKSLPDKVKVVDEKVKPTEADSLNKYKKTEPVFTIALLLALHLDSVSANEMQDLKRSRDTNISLDFYQGLLMAFDSLANDDLRLQLNVYDTKHDSNEVKKIFKKSEVKKSDFVIGPIFNDESVPAIQFSYLNDKYVLSPLAPASNSSFNSPYFISATAPIELHGRKQAEYILTTFDSKNVFILSGKSTAEQKYEAAFDETLKNSTKKIKAIRVGTSIENLKVLESLLKKNEKNIIFITTSSSSSLTRIFQKLKLLANNYDLVVFAHPLVPKMETLNFELLLPLNVHTSMAHYQNSDILYKSDFYMNYRKKYNTEPTEFAVDGFDLGMMFGKSIIKDGKDFGKKILNNPYSGLNGKYNFSEISGRGIQNNWLQIVKFNNYKFESE